MDTSLKRKTKTSVVKQLTLVQVLSILIISVVLIISFWVTTNRYLISKSQSELQQVADTLAKEISSSKGVFLDRITLGLARKLTYGITDTHFVILGPDRKIKGSTIESDFAPGKDIAENIWNRITRGVRRRVNSNDGFLYAYRKITAGPYTGGYVITLSRINYLHTVRSSVVGLLLKLLMIVGFVGVVFAFYLTRRISYPLKVLEEHAHRVASQDFSGRVEVSSYDEVGAVGYAFNIMVERLEDYHRAQQRFVQNASHELKSPLMNIQGYAEGLQEGLFTEEEEKSSLQVIVDESQRLKRVVEELLYLSKIDDSKQQKDYTDVLIEDIIQTAFRSVYARLNQKNISIDVKGNLEIYTYGDYDQLVRALANVLDNAVRYAKNGVQVAVTDASDSVEIYVMDDGKGFNEADLPHVLERFYKGDDGETGLGLAIANAIISQHGGTVNVGNDLDGGAYVKLRLSCSKGD